MLSRTLRVKIAAASRPGELKRRSGIKRNYSIEWPAAANRAVREHCWRRIQLHCPPVRARRNNVSG